MVAYNLSLSLLLAVIFSLTVPRLAYGLSIYDVIMLSQKGYEADDIKALIEATGSAFDLTAKDVVRLKEAGVSEIVIQAMLAVVILDPQEDPKTAPKPTASQEIKETDTPAPTTGGIHPRKFSQPPLVVIKKSPRKQSDLAAKTEGIIASIPVNEEGAGGHRHQAITLGNIKLLILRDEGAYSSVAGRAASVVRALQDAQAVRDGNFKANHAGGVHAVVYQTQDRREIVIISVSWRDALAYQIRSGRRIDPDILADYWGDLLSDYWSIIFQSAAPTRLNDLHEGEALQELSKQIAGVNIDDAGQMAEVTRSLPPEVQEHLELLAGTVPRTFGVNNIHELSE